MTQCHAFIQARMSSTRFPGKVLETIDGISTIEYMVRRVRRSRLVDGVVVVTSVDPSDDPLAAQLSISGIDCFRGPLDDVLGRYYAAARLYPANEYVRLTGDCPLIDPILIDSVISARRSASADYASNINPPSYPDGFDCEVFTDACLQIAESKAKLKAHREHVTLWMRTEEAALKIVNVQAPFDASNLRLTVDYPDDLEAVRRAVDLLLPNRTFDVFDILRVIATHPEIISLNPHMRNEALATTSPVAVPTGEHN